MTIVRVQPGGWSPNTKLTSSQISAVDANASYGLDKRTGQTDTLASSVTLTGGIAVASGGSISVTTGGSLSAASGTTVTLNGATTFGAGSSVTLPSVVVWRTVSAPITTSGSVGSPMLTVAAGGLAYQIVRVPNGSTISAITCTVISTATAMPSPRMSFAFYRMNLSTGVLTNLGSTLDPSTTIAQYSGAVHTVYSTLNVTVDNSTYLYFIELIAEAGVNSAPDCWFGSQVLVAVATTDLTGL